MFATNEKQCRNEIDGVYLRLTSVQKSVMAKVGAKAEFERDMGFVQTKRKKYKDDHKLPC